MPARFRIMSIRPTDTAKPKGDQEVFLHPLEVSGFDSQQYWCKFDITSADERVDIDRLWRARNEGTEITTGELDQAGGQIAKAKVFDALREAETLQASDHETIQLAISIMSIGPSPSSFLAPGVINLGDHQFRVTDYFDGGVGGRSMATFERLIDLESGAAPAPGLTYFQLIWETPEDGSESVKFSVVRHERI